MAQTQKMSKGGKCMTTSDTRKQFYVHHYGSMHHLATKGNKFTTSKEHRGCGPLARYNRRKQMEVQAIENGKRNFHPTLGELPFTNKSLRMLAYARANERGS